MHQWLHVGFVNGCLPWIRCFHLSGLGDTVGQTGTDQPRLLCRKLGHPPGCLPLRGASDRELGAQSTSGCLCGGKQYNSKIMPCNIIHWYCLILSSLCNLVTSINKSWHRRRKIGKIGGAWRSMRGRRSTSIRDAWISTMSYIFMGVQGAKPPEAVRFWTQLWLKPWYLGLFSLDGAKYWGGGKTIFPPPRAPPGPMPMEVVGERPMAWILVSW